MAIGDIGMFLPRESHYGTPGAFNKMLQAEALKRAAFLSNMDQFYANLGEAQRQFDETLTFKTETRDLELGWAREQQANELEFRREELESTDEYRQGLLELQEREIDEKYGGGDVDFLDKMRAWRIVEAEAKSRNEARDAAAEGIGPGKEPITPGSLWEGPGTKTTIPESGQVSSGGGTSGVDVYNPYGADLPRDPGRQARPGDVTDLEEDYEYYGVTKGGVYQNP
jgi:hypothetical protein